MHYQNSSSSSSSTSRAFFNVYHSPSQFLEVARPWLLKHERRSNIILPHAEKLSHQEERGVLAPGQFWLTAWSYPSSSSSRSRSPPTLDFALSCTEGAVDTYPLFLFSTHDVNTLPQQWLDDRMTQISEKLAEVVDPTRVFSIFGQERAVLSLSQRWSALTGFRIVTEPYYEASSTYCTRDTFSPARSPLPAGHVLRPAAHQDIDEVARMCQEFAEDSPPFTLTSARARIEAEYMVKNNYVWLYTVDGEISTVVAVTRSSPKVAGITKVYTTPAFRRQGCADRLVAHVLEQQFAKGMESVVLYVGHTLSAARVYHRVGFVGVGQGKSSTPIPDVERWLELGFANTTIGHW